MKRLGTFCTALLLTACTGAQTQTGLAVSGSALTGFGYTFVQVASVYQANCIPVPRLPKLTGFCRDFKTYGEKFKVAYPQAIDAWEVARKANDASKANDAAAVILQLSTDLTALTLSAIGSLQ